MNLTFGQRRWTTTNGSSACIWFQSSGACTYVDRRASTGGAVVGPDAYVLSEVPDGSVPVRPNKVNNNFRKLSLKSGVGIRLHDLRHFSITMLLSSGFDISNVAARHGHSHPSTMLDRFAHVLPERDREAADLLGRTLSLPVG